eukprot:8884723-Pyramimonas_sp.AAC.1
MLFGWPRRVLSHCVQLMYDEVATILAVNLLNYKYRRARVQAIKSSSTWLYLAPPWTIIFVRLRGDEEETSGSCALDRNLIPLLPARRSQAKLTCQNLEF